MSDVSTESCNIREVLYDQLSGNRGGVRVIVFNATFNNISVISWQSVLQVVETGEPGENHRPVASQ